MDEIAWSATVWAGVRRVEAVWCVMPGISGVLDGFHQVRAVSIAPQPGELGALAEFVMTRKRLSRWRSWLQESDLFALERVPRGLGEGTGQRELLSYVLFDDEYFAAQIDIGANAARAVLKQLDG